MSTITHFSPYDVYVLLPDEIFFSRTDLKVKFGDASVNPCVAEDRASRPDGDNRLTTFHATCIFDVELLMVHRRRLP